MTLIRKEHNIGSLPIVIEYETIDDVNSEAMIFTQKGGEHICTIDGEQINISLMKWQI